jgi:hypothetical protein
VARTGVEPDYKGEVIDAHAPEMPTRFAKQLAQLVRGAHANAAATMSRRTRRINLNLIGGRAACKEKAPHRGGA